MSVAEMTQRIAAVSPRSRARTTGVVYVLFFLTALLGEFFMRRAGMSGLGVGDSDSAATAHKILAHQSSFRLGFALSLVSIACYITVTALFYQLFRPVNKSLALLATFFSLVGLAIQAVGSLFLLASLVVLGGSQYLSAFTVEQVQALALLFLNVHAQVGSIDLIFDGLFLLLIGYLIFRSTFLPRFLGVLMAVAGFGWLTYLSPPLANALSPWIQGLGILAEGALMFWLLVIGVNDQRWTGQGGSVAEMSIAT